MLSLLFIVGFFSLLLLPLTCLSILFSMQPHQTSSDAATATTKPQLSSICRLLLSHTLFPNHTHPHSINSPPPKIEDKVRRYEGRGEREECVVCLCEVEQGQEISNLRCNHLFHKDCLDAWVGSGRPTCPLCRGSVFSPAVAEEGGSEVLIFRFMNRSRRARGDGNWWLR